MLFIQPTNEGRLGGSGSTCRQYLGLGTSLALPTTRRLGFEFHETISLDIDVDFSHQQQWRPKQPAKRVSSVPSLLQISKKPWSFHCLSNNAKNGRQIPIPCALKAVRVLEELRKALELTWTMMLMDLSYSAHRWQT